MPPPEEIQGAFWIVATVVVKKEKADSVQTIMEPVVKSARSDAEPGTLLYSVTRGVGDKSNHFRFLEKYASREALQVHEDTEVYKSLLASGALLEIAESLSLSYEQEI